MLQSETEQETYTNLVSILTFFIMVNIKLDDVREGISSKRRLD
jgi:hypothetical protein